LAASEYFNANYLFLRNQLEEFFCSEGLTAEILRPYRAGMEVGDSTTYHLDRVKDLIDDYFIETCWSFPQELQKRLKTTETESSHEVIYFPPQKSLASSQPAKKPKKIVPTQTTTISKSNPNV
jgi:hypothetical protein